MAELKPIVRKTKSGRTTTLRSPLAEDASEVLQVMQEIFKDHHPNFGRDASEFKATVAEQLEILKSYQAHPHQLYIGAYVDGHLVGLTSFKANDPRKSSHHGEFAMLMQTAVQGDGLGALMLEALLEWAAQHPHIEAVRLRVNASNAPAVALYRKYGFITEGVQIASNKHIDGHYDNVIWMVKVVKPIAEYKRLELEAAATQNEHAKLSSKT